jgi:tetratricopeptide (TPR) repeat protein
MRKRLPKPWNMRFVPIKTEDQLDLQALHRVRDRLVARRTSMINQVRAFLLERGISFHKGSASLRRQMPEILENADEKLSPAMRRLLDFLWQEWKGLQLQIESLNNQLEQIASSDPSCVRLQQIPGVGPLVSTAVVSAMGNGAAFKKGREFAAWLGLVHGNGQPEARPSLLGISNRGNPARAAELLEKAVPYDLAGAYTDLVVGTMYPVYVRGQVYLRLHRSHKASAEFQKIIDRRGFLMNFPLGALAHLGLARAYALSGDITNARTAYQAFLTLWKDADSDIPILKEAKAEYANLK